MPVQNQKTQYTSLDSSPIYFKRFRSGNKQYTGINDFASDTAY